MWQRFTERARKAVFFAQEEAAKLGETQVNTEHLLLGLVREKDTVAGRVLAGLGIKAGKLRSEVLNKCERKDDYRPGKDMQLTGRAKHAIDLAYDEARQLDNSYIGTEHLLIGLVREVDGLAGQVLRDLGADLERCRTCITGLQAADPELAGGPERGRLTRTVVLRPDTPPAGPFSPAIRCGGFVFVSGQAALDLATGDLVGDSVTGQARQTFHNLSTILEAAGASLSSVVKTTVYLVDLAQFQEMNEVFTEFFPAEPPARTTVQVAALPKGALFEIDAIAAVL